MMPGSRRGRPRLPTSWSAEWDAALRSAFEAQMGAILRCVTYRALANVRYHVRQAAARYQMQVKMETIPLNETECDLRVEITPLGRAA